MATFEDLFDLSDKDNDGNNDVPQNNIDESVSNGKSMGNNRFVPSAPNEISMAQQTVRPTNSVRKTQWVMRLFSEWKQSVASPPEYYSKKFNQLTDLQINALLSIVLIVKHVLNINLK
jgi:hypothetical protein